VSLSCNNNNPLDHGGENLTFTLYLTISYIASCVASAQYGL